MAEEFVSGPLRVDQPHPELPQALTDLIGRVTVAGGAPWRASRISTRPSSGPPR